MSISWLPALVIPGSGQLFEGRLFRAFVLLLFTFFGVNLFLLGQYLYAGDISATLTQWGLLAFGVAWLVGLLELFITKHTSDPRRFAAKLDEHLRRAMVFYLQGDFDEAEIELKAMLKLRPLDIEAHLYLAGVYRARGEVSKARSQYNKVLAIDEEGKWSWQIQRELKTLES